LLSGIGFFGDRIKIIKYSDDTNIFLKSYEEVDAAFEVFNNFKLASGSRISCKKTQLLPLGSFRNKPYLLKFAGIYTECVKIFGFSISTNGFDNESNWSTAEKAVQKLERCVPSKGISIFGRVNAVMTYFLSSFFYSMKLLSPPPALVRRTTSAMDRYIWFPSRRNLVSKKLIKLPTELGGLK
jgi:hypothetical protein